MQSCQGLEIASREIILPYATWSALSIRFATQRAFCLPILLPSPDFLHPLHHAPYSYPVLPMQFILPAPCCPSLPPPLTSFLRVRDMTTGSGVHPGF